jgi:gamma-butyrobetaine dioxygenase
VDSFAVAYDFTNDHPAAAKLLRTHEITFEYDNDGHHLSANRTILPSAHLERSLEAAVSWSPPFQGVRPPLNSLPPGDRGLSSAYLRAHFQVLAAQDRELVEAIALWESYLDRPKYKYEFKMEEGDLVMFDNRRVLHARRAFRDYTPEERLANSVPPPNEGEPSRWLKGCYLDGDAVWDKLYTLYRQGANKPQP